MSAISVLLAHLIHRYVFLFLCFGISCQKKEEDSHGAAVVVPNVQCTYVGNKCGFAY